MLGWQSGCIAFFCRTWERRHSAWRRVMDSNSFSKGYAACSTSAVLCARPVGIFAALMIGAVPLWILGAASIFASPDSSRENVAATPAKCEPKLIFEGRTGRDDAGLRQISLNCDGWADLSLIVPDDQREPIRALFDRFKRKKADVVVLDYERKGRWSISYWDVDLDDTFSTIGIHPDGAMQPTRFELRCKYGAATKDGGCNYLPAFALGGGMLRH